jgi:hypothetical protein
MVESFLATLYNLAADTRDAFLWPAARLLAEADAILPGALDLAGVEADDPKAILVTAGLLWLLVGIGVTAILRLVRRMLRQCLAMLRVIVFRLDLLLRSWKTKFVCASRSLLAWRRTSALVEPGRVEFDDLEIGILRYAADRGPGFAISAPELAEAFSLRPAQVQRGIDSLVKNRMLDYTLGSTEGYDNYRLTDPGAAFLALCDRQQPDTLPAYS